MKLLLVEDEAETRELLREFLSEGGVFEVRAVASAREALEALEKDRFEVVITDLVLPDLSGMEVLRRSRALHPETPVVIITGFASLDTALRAIREGAYDYLTKPFALEELAVTVHNAAERVRLHRENECLLRSLQRAEEELRRLRKFRERLRRELEEMDRQLEAKEAEIADHLERLRMTAGAPLHPGKQGKWT